MSSKAWNWLKSLRKRFAAKNALLIKMRRRAKFLRFEPLEERRLMAVFDVLNTNDAGLGSFRQAILDSNSSVGVRDSIVFNIPQTDPGYVAATDSFVIKPNVSAFVALPFITDSVNIDAYSQPGASPNTLPVADNGVLKIEISGANTQLSDYAWGLVITAGNSTVRGLAIDGFSGGEISLATNGGNVLQGNFIGTDVTGTVGVGGSPYGIYVNTDGNTIGSQGIVGDFAERNVIFTGIRTVSPYATGAAVYLSSNNNTVAGNYIGTDKTGDHSLGSSGVIYPGSGSGVYFAGNNNRIGSDGSGTADVEQRNVISGNLLGAGVFMQGSHNVVAGDFIGTDATGTHAVPNQSGAANWGGDGNLIGTNAVGVANASTRNLISGNAVHGIATTIGGANNVIKGNYIGTDVTGTLALPNGASGIIDSSLHLTIGGPTPPERNIISGNGQTGITEFASHGAVIQGNYIGMDVTGLLPLGNAGGGINESGNNDLVGGPNPGEGNLISGNISGILVQANNSTIQGNLIGTDKTGTVKIGNGPAIGIYGYPPTAYYGGVGIIVSDGSVGVLIGGTTPGSRNIISGNNDTGIVIGGNSAYPVGPTGVVVQGNYIGTDINGIAPLGNGGYGGVFIWNYAANVQIGGTAAGAGNVISANIRANVDIQGVYTSTTGANDNIVQGNKIGTDATGTHVVGSSLYGVEILGAEGNIIGGSAPGAANIIAGATSAGVEIHGATNLGGSFGNQGWFRADAGGGDPNSALYGNDYATLVNGASYGPGVSGQAFQLNGANQYADMGSAYFYDQTLPLSLDAWVNPNILSLPGSAQTIFSKYDSLDTLNHGTGWLLQEADGGRVRFKVCQTQEGNISRTVETDNPVLTTSHWQHVAAVFDPTDQSMTIYVNGIAVPSTLVAGWASVSNIAVTSTPVRIGKSFDGVSNSWNGSLDELGIFLYTPLTAAQVQSIYASAGKGQGGGNTVQGNYIGTDPTGTANLGNSGDGIRVETYGGYGPSSNNIGGTIAGAGNVIANNGGFGVELISDFDYGYGSRVMFDTGTGNSILGNSIYNNAKIGINLYGGVEDANAVTSNHTGFRRGPNYLENHPVITSTTVTAGNISVQGSLNSLANTTYRIELFANPSSASGTEQGQVYLGATTVTTDNAGNATINAQISATVPAGYTYVTATATDSAGNTSEYSTPAAITNVSLPHGIVAWWPAENNTIDIAGGHNGTIINGASYGIGEVATSFSFNGSGQYVSVPSDPTLNLSSAITLDAWVAVSSTGTYQFFINKFNHNGGSLDDSYDIGLEPNGVIRLQIDTLNAQSVLADNIFDVNPPVSIFDGHFHHVAGTYDGTVMKVYFDGGLIGTQAATGNIVSTNTPVLLGAGLNNGTPAYFQNGKLDEASIYNRALSAAEIQAIFNAGSAGKSSYQTSVWIGGGANNNLSNPVNWLGGIVPQVGGQLIFNTSGTISLVNDLPAGTTCGSITFNGSGTVLLTGNAISITGGITVTGSVAVDIQVDVTLAGAQSINCDGGSLTIDGAINNGGYDLVLNGSASIQLTGAINGSGGLTKNGTGLLTLYGVAPNTYTGATFINKGVVWIQKGTAFGSVGSGTTIAIGATVKVSGGISVYENIIINGFGFDGNGALISVGGLVNYWYGSVTLGSASAIASIAITDNIWFNGAINLGTYNLVCCGEGFLKLFGAISGSGGLTKIGGSTLIICGPDANTYTGETLINNGVAWIQKGTAFGATAITGGTTIAVGATVKVSGGISVYENITINGYGFDGNGCLISVGGLVNYWYGSVTLGSASAIASIAITDNIWFNGAINLGTYNLVCCGEGFLELFGAISGSGGLTKIGGSTLIICGNDPNTYTGATFVNGGVVWIQKGTAFGAVGSGTVVADGATVKVSGGISVYENITINGNGFDGNGCLISVGGTNYWNGSVTLGSASAIASITITDNIWFNGVINLGSYGLVCCGEGFLELFGAISGSGGLTKIGGSTLIICGNDPNTYTGATFVNGGVVWIQKGTAFGAIDSGTTIAIGATVKVSGNISVFENITINGYGFDGNGCLISVGGTNYWNGSVTLGSASAIASITINDNIWFNGAINLGSYGLICCGEGFLELFGAISGSGGLTKIGGSTLIICGVATNTYTGETLISKGIVWIQKDTAFGAVSGGTVVADGATVKVSGGISIYENITINGNGFDGNGCLISVGGLVNYWHGSVTLGSASAIASIAITDNIWFNGAINLGSYGLVCCGEGFLELFGAISGSGGLTKIGGSTLIICGVATNTYTGETLISKGIVWIQKDTAFGAVSGGTVIAAGATVKVSGNISVFENITINGNGFDGNGCLISVGGTNYWNGTVTLGSASAIASITINDNIWFNGAINLGSYGLVCCGEGFLQLVGAIGGSGGLTKIGIGTLVIGGVNINTYAGLMTVNQGVLLVNGTLPGSAVTVNAGATLGGTGIVGTITIHGGIVSPGISGAGVLNASSALFDTSSRYRVDLNGTTPGIGVNRYDQLALTGNVNLGNATLEVLVGFASAVGDQFTILKTAGVLTGSFGQGSSIFVNGVAFSITYTANTVVLTHVKLGSITTLTASAPTTEYGQVVNFTATVSPSIFGAGTPTGIVTFFDGTSVIGTSNLVGGIATLAVNSLSVGIHSITAKYNSDGNFDASLSQVLQQTISSSPGAPLAAGQTATIGYWQNKNGQALINSLNGGPHSTSLGNWLASQFPNMYGGVAGAKNLTGKTNSQVAAFYVSLFNVTGPKLDAQVMATALAVYVTNTDLAGIGAAQYGFRTSTAGTGAATFDVGTSGSAFGVPNGTRMTILQILSAANARAVRGKLYNGTTSLQNLAIVVFDGINQRGDLL